MKAILAFVVVTVAGLIAALLFYLGAHKGVEVATAEAGPYRVVFKHHIGPYHKIVPAIEEVERWATANGELCVTSFGEYIDSPDRVDEDRLNSNGGCVVKGDWSGKLPAGLETKEIPRREFVRAVFEGAPSIGPFKVYPKVQDFMKSQNLVGETPVYEMYERLPGAKLRTEYLFPFSRSK